MRGVISVLLLVFSLSSLAKAEDYEYCIIWGVAGGVGDDFIQSLAGRVLHKKGISPLDKVCTELKKTSFKQGQLVSQGDTSNKDAFESWNMYQFFRDKVMDGLVDLLSL